MTSSQQDVVVRVSGVSSAPSWPVTPPVLPFLFRSSSQLAVLPGRPLFGRTGPASADKKTRWIREKLRLQKDQRPIRPKEYVNGESFSYLGRHYRLKITSGPVKSVKLVGGRLTVTVPPSVRKREQYIQNALTEWCRTHALARLREKVARHSQRLGVAPQSVGVRTFRNRWGSCNASGHVQFNWKITLAPNRIVDYVVVHELCHLLHHNHSPEFWRTLERVFPDYKEFKEWLRVNGRYLFV